MAAPKIGRVMTQEMDDSESAPVVPPATAAESDAPVMGWQLDDLESFAPQNRPPDLPAWLATKLHEKGLVYRWLSKVMIDKLGKRGYTLYSPDAKDRSRIDSGDVPAGVHVDEQNQVRFLDDLRLGVMARRHWELRQASKKHATISQTELSLKGQRARLQEQVARAGGRISRWDAKTWESRYADAREDKDDD